MAHTERQWKRRGCRRNRQRQSGGGTGNSYTFAGSVDPQNASLGNAAKVVPFSSCGEVARPGYIANASIQGGLPGFAGGSRRGSRKGRGNRKSKSKKMRGGVYSLTGSEVVNGIGMSTRNYTGCGEGQFSVGNTLNQQGPSTLTAPLKQLGGGVDSMAYSVPRAGYAIMPSQGSVLSDGITGYEGRIGYSGSPYPSSACLKTGGRRRSNKRSNNKRSNKRSNRRSNKRSNKRSNRRSRKN